MSDKKRAPKKITINYQNGKIYKIVNDVNDMIYIGSTTQTLSRRFSGHKSKSKTKTADFLTAMSTIGFEHFKIILVEPYPCKSKEELVAREYEIAKTFKREELYNAIIDGTLNGAGRKKMSDNSARKGKFGHENPGFKRGCVCPIKNGFRFTWSVEGDINTKSFCYGAIRTSEMAYQACVDLQNQIFPLTNKDYLKELPFADEE